MATCNVQSLLSADPCLSALDTYRLEVLITQQLCNLFNFLDSAEPVTCDVQELLEDSSCFNGLSINQLKVIQAQLLCNIASLL